MGLLKSVCSFTAYFLCLVKDMFLGFLRLIIRPPSLSKLKRIAQTLPRDFKALYRYSKVKFAYNRDMSQCNTIPVLFDKHVKKHPEKVCLVDSRTGKSWTYKEVDEYSNQVANCFQNLGYKAGDEIALYMDNCSEYVMIWLGLSKLGVTVALINSNLKQIPLTHSITCVKSLAVIFGHSMLSAIKEVEKDILSKRGLISFYCYGGTKESLEDFSAELIQPKIDESLRTFTIHRAKMSDTLLYIYTSGTTGLPKAAVIKHSRYLISVMGIHYMWRIRDEDILYITLPLYHGMCGMLGIGQVLIYGNTGVISPKLTVSKFWDECAKYKCTVSLYIGEVCKYLLAQPEKPIDKTHTIRLMLGNGLRRHIWNDFTTRFNIKEIGEFFSSTEGNANLVNIDSFPGAVGFLPVYRDLLPGILNKVHPVKLIRINEDTGEPDRDENGLCVDCRPGETGEMVGLTIPSNLQTYDGYSNEDDTKKKLYYNVAEHGDSAFASGDLLHMDEYGYVYFMDRTGDTFRWKGENVSTMEVEAVISKLLDQKDVVVYGVQVANTDGKAGMIGILDPEKKTNLDDFLNAVKTALPAYAIPVFVRLMQEIDATSTFKFKKRELQKVGFNPKLCKDPLFVLDQSLKKYVPITDDVYDKICKELIRL